VGDINSYVKKSKHWKKKEKTREIQRLQIHMLLKDMKIKLKMGDSTTDLLHIKTSLQIWYSPKDEYDAWFNTSTKYRICYHGVETVCCILVTSFCLLSAPENCI